MLDSTAIAQILTRERSGLAVYLYSVIRNYHLAVDVLRTAIAGRLPA